MREEEEFGDRGVYDGVDTYKEGGGGGYMIT